VAFGEGVGEREEREYGTRKIKNDTDIQNVFPKCIFSVAVLQIEILLLRIRGFLPKEWKSSSEGC